MKPRTSRRFPAIDPTSDALTMSVKPSEMATMAMINSGALPNVAFKKPPTPGPVWSARLSVASPISQESGSSAKAASRKSSIWPAASTRSRTTTSAPNSNGSASSAPRPTFLPELPTIILLRVAGEGQPEFAESASRKGSLPAKPAQKLRSVDAARSRWRVGSTRPPARACTPGLPRSERSSRLGERRGHPHQGESTGGAVR